jgi:hypothetical protein
MTGCFAVIAAFFTAGISLILLPIVGIVWLISDFTTILTPKERVEREIAAATRYHCRMCSLDWYESERASIQKALGI